MPLFTIETQYNTDEETRNFGPRATCETNGSIYESTTTATIQFDEEVCKQIFKFCSYHVFFIHLLNFIFKIFIYI